MSRDAEVNHSADNERVLSEGVIQRNRVPSPASKLFLSICNRSAVIQFPTVNRHKFFKRGGSGFHGNHASWVVSTPCDRPRFNYQQLNIYKFFKRRGSGFYCNHANLFVSHYAIGCDSITNSQRGGCFSNRADQDSIPDTQVYSSRYQGLSRGSIPGFRISEHLSDSGDQSLVRVRDGFSCPQQTSNVNSIPRESVNSFSSE
jgi:hypothetical protein